MTKLALGERVDVVPGLLSWERVHNVRTAYGLFSAQPWMLVVVSTFVLTLFGYVLRDLIARETIPRIAFAVIAGGAIGNVIDRLFYGFVIDFIILRPLPIFEVFNVADSFVSIGAVVLFVTTFARERRRPPAS